MAPQVDAFTPDACLLYVLHCFEVLCDGVRYHVHVESGVNEPLGKCIVSITFVRVVVFSFFHTGCGAVHCVKAGTPRDRHGHGHRH